VCASSLSYLACKAHALSYIFICDLSGFLIFFHITLQWHDILKKILSIKYVFLFSLQLLSEIFLVLRRNERDVIKNVYWSHM